MLNVDNKASRKALDTSAMDALLGYRLAKAYVPAIAVFEEAVGEPLKLKRVEFTILILLRSNADVTLKDLCQELSVSAPHLSVVVERLVKRELVHREPSKSDGRAQILKLTNQGQALAEKALGIASGMEAELLSHLSPAERAMLFELLRKAAETNLGAHRR